MSACLFAAPQFHNLQELRHSASLANKVFIQRDYSEGTSCRFQTKFPSELESRVRAPILPNLILASSQEKNPFRLGCPDCCLSLCLLGIRFLKSV